MQPEFVLLPRLLSLHIVAPWRRQGAQLYSPFLVTHKSHRNGGKRKVTCCEYRDLWILANKENRAAQVEGNNISLCRLFASVQSNNYSSELSMEKNQHTFGQKELSFWLRGWKVHNYRLHKWISRKFREHVWNQSILRVYCHNLWVELFKKKQIAC